MHSMGMWTRSEDPLNYSYLAGNPGANTSAVLGVELTFQHHCEECALRAIPQSGSRWTFLTHWGTSAPRG